MKIPSVLKGEKNIVSLLNQMTRAALGFISFIILTRTFEKSVFGEWVLLITSAGFVEMIRFGLTRTAIVRFLSASKEKESNELKGSNWMIGLIITVIIAIVIFAINMIFNNAIQNSGYKYFFKWYPILAFLNLPLNNAITILQAEQRFDRILFIRNFPMVLFLIFLTLNFFILKYNIETVILIFMGITGFTSIVSILKKWDGLIFLKYSNKARIKQILDFGKYSTATLIGSNLLKSADTFILGLSPFIGPAGVALYSIPLKLTEVMEIPLRSFTATAFPKMSKASIEKDNSKVRQLFYAYSGSLTLLFIPVLILAFIFAEPLVTIVGGKEYIETANIFRIFCIYGLLLPMDRLTGVGLDSVNMPKRNFYKVIYMALANIIGDIIAVFVIVQFYPDISIISILMLVSSVTILMTLIGLVVGLKYFNKEIQFSIFRIFKEGYWFYKGMYRRIVKNSK